MNSFDKISVINWKPATQNKFKINFFSKNQFVNGMPLNSNKIRNKLSQYI